MVGWTDGIGFWNTVVYQCSRCGEGDVYFTMQANTMSKVSESGTWHDDGEVHCTGTELICGY